MSQLTLKLMTVGDCRFVYQLLKERQNEPNVNINFQMPTYEDHKEYLLDALYFEWYKQAFIMYIGRKKIGQVYVTKDNEIGVFVLKAYQGKGYGREAVKRIIQATESDVFTAHVNGANEKSKRLFKALGFKLKRTEELYELKLS